MVEVIFSNDKLLAQEKIAGVKKQIEKDYGVFESFEFSTQAQNFKLDAVEEALYTISMFHERKLVVLMIESDKDAAKLDEEKLCSLLSVNDFSVNFLVWFAKKPLAKTKVKKTIDKHAKIYDLKAMDDRTFQTRVQNLSTDYNVTFNSNAFNLFVSRLDKNFQSADSYLSMFSSLGRAIDPVDVESLVSKSVFSTNLNTDVFALPNALLQKDLKLSFEIYHQLLKQKSDPLALLGLVGSSLRNIFQISALTRKGYSKQGVADILQMSTGQVNFLSRNMLREPQAVLALLNELGRIDQEVKLGKLDRFVAFELFLLEACQ